jgi:hypothetical protein
LSRLILGRKRPAEATSLAEKSIKRHALYWEPGTQCRVHESGFAPLRTVTDEQFAVCRGRGSQWAKETDDQGQLAIGGNPANIDAVRPPKVIATSLNPTEANKIVMTVHQGRALQPETRPGFHYPVYVHGEQLNTDDMDHRIDIGHVLFDRLKEKPSPPLRITVKPSAAIRVDKALQIGQARPPLPMLPAV